MAFCGTGNNHLQLNKEEPIENGEPLDGAE